VGNGNAVQRRGILAGPLVGGAGLGQGQLPVHGDKGIEVRVPLDAVKIPLRQFDRGKLAAAQAFDQLCQTLRVHERGSVRNMAELWRGCAYSMTLGTRYSPASTAGAMP
jgi:hypothetical protein